MLKRECIANDHADHVDCDCVELDCAIQDANQNIEHLGLVASPLCNSKNCSGYHPLHRIFPTLKLLFQIGLQETILFRSVFSEGGSHRVAAPVSSAIDAVSGQSLLKPMRDATQVAYSSAIAHKLAAQIQQPAPQIATQIAAQIARSFQLNQAMATPIAKPPDWLELDWPELDWPELPLQKEIWATTTLHITQSGLLQFKLEDRAIALWLDFLVHHPPVSPATSLFPFPLPACFPLYHAHARCCSLLQLAQREDLILLDQPLLDQPMSNPAVRNPKGWQFTAPASIPWLAPSMKLWLDHAAERLLIRQLVTTMDAVLDLPSSPSLEADLAVVYPLALKLSQTFQEFHRRCPILQNRPFSNEEVIAHTQARLGLVMATQLVLRLVLEDLLGLPAPAEL